MPTKFNMTKDVAGYNGFGVQPCLDQQSGVLAANVAQSITVPSEYPAYIAVLSYTPGANVWVDCVTTAAAPTGAFAATTACLNPTGLRVLKGTTMSFITADAAGSYVSVRFFVVPEFGN